MTKTHDLAGLAQTGQARTVPLTRAQLLSHVAVHFAQFGNKSFKAPLQVENMKLEDLRAAPVAGHIFAEVSTALGTAGVVTDDKMASAMDPLGFTQDHVHAFCGCHGEDITGATASGVFSRFAKQAEGAA